MKNLVIATLPLMIHIVICAQGIPPRVIKILIIQVPHVLITITCITDQYVEVSDNPLFQTQAGERDQSVVCFSPDHSVKLFPNYLLVAAYVNR